MSRKLLQGGTILNRYRIEKIIGVGGFGVTYLAMEPVHRQYVAIKEYFPKKLASRQTGNTIVASSSREDQRVFKWGLKRFIDEAKVLARLDHPSIIKVQRYFELHGTAYLVMDYCDGIPLDKYVEEGAELSPGRVIKIFMALINALEHVHQHGIIHGDLKPSNILLRSDGIPVLIDFGSARQELMRLAVGQVSDGYSPPEFYETSDNIGPWSDIYGLAATFYRLITGVKVPVASERSKSDYYTPISTSIYNNYNERFLELIDTSLKLKSSERPQSIASLKRLVPEGLTFSDNSKSHRKLLRDEPSPWLLVNGLSNWRPAAVVVMVLIFLGAIFFKFNKKAEDHGVTDFEQPKVQPIQIDESSTSNTDAPVLVSNRSTTLSSLNSVFSQELAYLSRSSTSNEISFHSVPKSEQNDRSLQYVFSEIHKQMIAIEERKDFFYNKSSDEFVYKNLMLAGVTKLTFIGNETKCSINALGPPAGYCWKSSKDYKCQFIDLPEKYTHICISSISVK